MITIAARIRTLFDSCAIHNYYYLLMAAYPVTVHVPSKFQIALNSELGVCRYSTCRSYQQLLLIQLVHVVKRNLCRNTLLFLVMPMFFR